MADDAISLSGSSEAPNAAPEQAANPCSISLRLSMIDPSAKWTVDYV